MISPPYCNWNLRSSTGAVYLQGRRFVWVSFWFSSKASLQFKFPFYRTSGRGTFDLDDLAETTMGQELDPGGSDAMVTDVALATQ